MWQRDFYKEKGIFRRELKRMEEQGEIGHVVS